MLDRIQALKPDHILVTGDLTNWAKEQQFSEVRELFKNSQMMIRGKTSLKDLDPALWTILPGNHDVTETNRAPGKERRNLGMFFQYFGELYPGSGPDYGGAFPVWRQLPRKAPDGISVHLFGIDSNVEYPVSTVGLNARGRIDDAQLDRFAAKLEMPEKDELVLVALHHHPVIVPHIVHELEDYFLSLKEEDGKKLIKLCANTGVHAVLHGHFHQFSFWSVLAPQGTHQMAVIGAPCGTMDVPGVNVDFLELREASREARSGPRRGLALYRHSYQSRQWKREYIAFVE
jgi:3',5'-cyclic AMP phosphodiesterase CpdA